MSGQYPPPPAPRPGVTVLLVVLGVILLLPGLCSLVVAAQVIATDDIVRLATRDPFFQAIMMLWGVCFLVSAGGIALLWVASRRARASRDPRP